MRLETLIFKTEKSIGTDLTLRKKGEKISGSIGVFYNKFSNFLGLNPTNEVIDELKCL